MIFIIPGILLCGFICLGIWGLLFRTTLRQERLVREARQRQANFENCLKRPGELLYCVACQKLFCGPLSTDGCPDCHTRAFVIPASASDDARVAKQVLAISLAVPDCKETTSQEVSATVSTENHPSQTVLQQGKTNYENF